MNFVFDWKEYLLYERNQQRNQWNIFNWLHKFKTTNYGSTESNTKKSTLTIYTVVAHMIESELEIIDTTLSLEEIQLIKDRFC